MTNKTNFFIKAITSIYDIRVFSKYAKEGIFRAISYSVLFTLILSGMKSAFMNYITGKFDFNVFIYMFFKNFEVILINLFINSLIVAMVASLFTLFMRMMVKYAALYSLTLYAATLPLMIQTLLETVYPDINFDTMFIVGTLTYVV